MTIEKIRANILCNRVFMDLNGDIYEGNQNYSPFIVLIDGKMWFPGNKSPFFSDIQTAQRTFREWFRYQVKQAYGEDKQIPSSWGNGYGWDNSIESWNDFKKLVNFKVITYDEWQKMQKEQQYL